MRRGEVEVLAVIVVAVVAGTLAVGVVKFNGAEFPEMFSSRHELVWVLVLVVVELSEHGGD